MLVRFWDRLDDPDDWLINASNKSLLSLIDPDWGADVSRIPPRVQGMIAQSVREYGQVETCSVVRAVAIEGW